MVKKSRQKYPKRGDNTFGLSEIVLFKKIIAGSIGFFLLFFLALGIYSYRDSFTPKQPVQKASERVSQTASTEALMQKMKEMLDDEKIRLEALQRTETNQSVEAREHNTTVNDVSTQTDLHVKKEDARTHELSEVHEYRQSLKEEKTSNYKPSEVIRKKYPAGTIPKLAIIIDDVSFPWQTNMMKLIPYKVTPAFFPPTKGHPETVRLSHEFPFAMIHLPLEAKYYSRPEEDTLNTTDSYETIEKRIKRIKEWFPHITYYNNHTGGYFTGHYEAMDKLIKIMKDNHLIFVDSRTIGASQAPAVARKYGMFLYSRDVFLDNSLDKKLIQEQLIKSVHAAKKHGYAIAIGHPHKNTLEVLRDSKELLHGVEMVYVNEL